MQLLIWLPLNTLASVSTALKLAPARFGLPGVRRQHVMASVVAGGKGGH